MLIEQFKEKFSSLPPALDMCLSKAGTEIKRRVILWKWSEHEANDSVVLV